MPRFLGSACLLALAMGAAPVAAQSFPVDDPTLRQIWAEGMVRSQVTGLLQVLSDSIGPRLTGSPGILAGQEWLKASYAKWGITARSEKYGTWTGWRRGPTHIDLIAPRLRSLEGQMLAWSPGTKGKSVEGGTVILGNPSDSAAFAAWLPLAKGKFVLMSFNEPTCRTDSSYVKWAGLEAFASMAIRREADREARTEQVPSRGAGANALAARLEAAGALGLISSSWSSGWGTARFFQARTTQVPTVGLGCEDYTLLYRLTEHRQGPVLRVSAESEFGGDVPVFNVIGEIKGREKPNEYVMLSAHFDTWDGASGTTDNGTGTVIMMEAMRILKTVYPNPKRTLQVGHWSGEEQGLNGSHAFVEDHPDVLDGLHALFNQDNGTGRVASVSTSGLVGAGVQFGHWFSRLPDELSKGVELSLPGLPSGGGTDHGSFSCAGAPGFNLGSESAEYGEYTWHSNRDTFDKLLPENLRRNATIVAMLAYLAAEDPVKTPRDRRILPVVDGKQTVWPECNKAVRSRAQWLR
ncbi:MAG: M20/M25/M40 family metallo-hydrolase [Gemmatimonadales bacterium]|nr:M20/M25/M40 family metallo-hydrolase [Gemmatimonadales bacterium]